MSDGQAALQEVERLRAESLAARTKWQDALEAIGEAASALEHERPMCWSPSAVARLRRAADYLRSANADKARSLLDYLSDMVSSGDVVFRRLRNPELYAADLDKAQVIEVRLHEDERAEEALLREALEHGTPEFLADLRACDG